MAWDFGGTYGGQPSNDEQPQYPVQPSYGQPPIHGQPFYGQQPQYPGQLPYDMPQYGQPLAPVADPGAARRRRGRAVGWAVVGAGALVAVIAAVGIVVGAGPRQFNATQKQQITDWEYGQRWRDLPAGTIFPASVSYSPPTLLDDDPSLRLTAQRVGIARQSDCAAVTDPSAATVLNRDGCSAVIRATYVDQTSSFVVTVAAAVLPTTAQATAAGESLNGAGAVGLGPTVHAMSVAGTPASAFTDARRELSGADARGTYVVLYTVGYADSRHKQKVAQDTYTTSEMTSMGTGVADSVLSTLAAAVPPPTCPGVPGC